MLALAINVGVTQVMSQHTYKVGNVCYLQISGGAIAIGLELTGAVSRPFMRSWDLRYLVMVANAGMAMRMYKRYVDDFNQVAEVPPAGAVYDS